MDGSRRMVLLLGVSLLTSLTGCHGRFLIPPPPRYAYGANPAMGGAYGQYGDCVNGGGVAPYPGGYGYGGGGYGGGYGYGGGGYGAQGQRLQDLRENLQARRDDRLAHRQGRRDRPRGARKHGRRGAPGEIGCDTYYDVGCDGSGLCDIGGACNSCDGCGECDFGYDVECSDCCTSCGGCGSMSGCGGMMMGGTNPGPYVAYLIPMESYQGELGGGMCCDGLSGCDSCGSGIIDGGMMSGGLGEYGDGGMCTRGCCQTFSGDDQNWQTVPGQLESPDASPSGLVPQPIRRRPQETLPVPPSSTDPSDPAEGDFQQPSTPGGEAQADYSTHQKSLWVPNQF